MKTNIATKLMTLSLSLVLTISGAWAEASYSTSLLTDRFASWGINPSNAKSSIQLQDHWKKFKKNKEIVVAVVDTGIQVDHPFLKENIHTISGQKSAQNYGVDFSGGVATKTPSDAHGHGTHIAGIIKSIFPDVRILALKYYNPQASGLANLNATIKALEYAVDQNVDIINYSGGGPMPSADELAVLKRAEQKGILIIAAAGNEKSNIDNKEQAYYPASYGLSNIITVTAHDEYNKILPSSNWGERSVDIAAPGYRIRSAGINNSVAFMTGTSQATAFVTGVMALIKAQYPNLDYKQLRNIVINSSLYTPSLEGKVLGAGKLNAARAYEVAEQVNNFKANGRSVAQR